MMNSKKKQTIEELQNEYAQKLQIERRGKFQEKYQILSDLYRWVIRHNQFQGVKGVPALSAPIPKNKLTRLQKICKAFLDFLLKNKKK